MYRWQILNKILNDVKDGDWAKDCPEATLGYDMPDGKYHIFIYLDSTIDNDKLYYTIEPNEIIDGGCEPMGDTYQAEYGNFAELLMGCVWCMDLFYEKGEKYA